MDLQIIMFVNYLSIKTMYEKASVQMHQSKRMKLVSERLHRLNKSTLNNFKIDSKTDKVTRITLQLKLINSNIY